MRFAAIERAEPGIDEIFLPVTIRLAERRAGLGQHDGAGDQCGLFGQQLLNDHAADRVPDDDRSCRADLLQEILQGVREAGAMLTPGSGADPP